MEFRATTRRSEPTPSRRRSRLASSLANLRSAAGLNQLDLERLSGVDASRLSRIENQHADPRASELVLLADALEVGLDRLVFGEAEPVDPIVGLVRRLRAEDRSVVESMLSGLVSARRVEIRIDLSHSEAT